MLLGALLAGLPFLPGVLSWGAAGHEIVATIAQIHLFPSTREKICSILPPEAKCHLAPVAAWADQVRQKYRGTAGMHYVNAKDDHPADHCAFGEHGWMDEDVNVLTAIANMTQLVMDGKGRVGSITRAASEVKLMGRDIPLRFLVHFVGDMHQPLHLSGRDKGGNGAMFRWEGHARNLHSVWDSGILTKKIRELGNYTSPLPSKHIEAALPGAIFDPYVRFIVWEGIREWFRDSIDDWLACPASGDPYPHSSLAAVPASAALLPTSFPALASTVRSAGSFLLNILPNPVSLFLEITSPVPLPLKETEGFNERLLSIHPANRVRAEGQSLASTDRANGEPAEQDTEGEPFPACPYTWAAPLHELNCAIAWPVEYTGNRSEPLIELDSEEYYGRIVNEKTMERLMAMAGLRLAKILNEALGHEKGLYFAY